VVVAAGGSGFLPLAVTICKKQLLRTVGPSSRGTPGLCHAIQPAVLAIGH